MRNAPYGNDTMGKKTPDEKEIKELMEFVKALFILGGIAGIAFVLFRMVAFFFARFVGASFGFILTILLCFGIGYGYSWLKKTYGPK